MVGGIQTYEADSGALRLKTINPGIVYAEAGGLESGIFRYYNPVWTVRYWPPFRCLLSLSPHPPQPRYRV